MSDRCTATGGNNLNANQPSRAGAFEREQKARVNEDDDVGRVISRHNTRTRVLSQLWRARTRTTNNKTHARTHSTTQKKHRTPLHRPTANQPTPRNTWLAGCSALAVDYVRARVYTHATVCMRASVSIVWQLWPESLCAQFFSSLVSTTTTTSAAICLCECLVVFRDPGFVAVWLFFLRCVRTLWGRE